MTRLFPQIPNKTFSLLPAFSKKFCNEHHLFIAVPKTHVTVFHSECDDKVVYEGDRVTVEDNVVDIRFYGKA
eukprot:7340088-Karenia_brevis.AAC.1